uniref:Uncharacterized protein LOC101290797 n=1 Tax=Rhizophora mucronata TaxID=61149 RepID=A0A2P2PIG4_RHIMU
MLSLELKLSSFGNSIIYRNASSADVTFRSMFLGIKYPSIIDNTHSISQRSLILIKVSCRFCSIINILVSSLAGCFVPVFIRLYASCQAKLVGSDDPAIFFTLPPFCFWLFPFASLSGL